MNRILYGIYCLALGLLVAAPAKGEVSKPLLVEAVNYKTVQAIKGCREESYHKPRLYPQCTDPEALYAKAKEFAAANQMPLMILWGFDECPGCQFFENQYMNDDKLLDTEAFGSVLTKSQLAQFHSLTGGNGQIAFVRMNSHRSLSHFLKFADRIGATKVAEKLGSHKVWSPMIMIVNSETGALATNNFFGGRSYCTLAEELREGFIQTGILSTAFETNTVCYAPSELSGDQVADLQTACDERGDSKSCLWASAAYQDQIEAAEEEGEETAALIQKSASYAKRSCDAGVAAACAQYGWFLRDHGAVLSSPDSASTYFERACELGNMEGCFDFSSDLLLHGTSISDKRRGWSLVQKACFAMEPRSCGKLGNGADYDIPITMLPAVDRAKAQRAFSCRSGYEQYCEK